MKNKLRILPMAVALATAASAYAEQASGSLLLVVNKGTRDSTVPSELAIVDPTTHHVLGRVPTGMESHEVAVAPDGKTAIVTNTGPYSNPGHTLSLIDLQARKEVKRVELGAMPNPHGIVWQDGKFYFTAEGAKLIARFDPDKVSVDWITGIGQNSTHMLVFSKDGKKAYTANRGSATVGVVPVQTAKAMEEHRKPTQGATGGLPRAIGAGKGPMGPGQGPGPGGFVDPSTVSLIRVGQGPEGIDITPDGKEVWVGCQGALSIIDTSTDQVVGAVDAGGGGGVNRVKVTLDGKYALATGWGKPLLIIDVASRKVIKRVETGGSGASILLTPDGKQAYVSMTDANSVAVIDLAKLEVVSTFTTGPGPDGMAWVPAHNE